MIKSNQIKKKEKNTIFTIIATLYRESGWRAFYKGFYSSLFLVMNPLIQYSAYESIKTWAVGNNKRKKLYIHHLLLYMVLKINLQIYMVGLNY